MTGWYAARLLERLGSTADEVAASLKRLGVKGRRGSALTCPLAKYLNSRLPGTQPTKVSSVSFQVTGSQLYVPAGCSDFVRRFDIGRYPELDIDHKPLTFWGRIKNLLVTPLPMPSGAATHNRPARLNLTLKSKP